jgi:hypothetical protein
LLEEELGIPGPDPIYAETVSVAAQLAISS